MEPPSETERLAYSVDGSLTIYNAAAIWARVHAYIKERRPLMLDLSKVVECDAAGVQILCVLAHNARLPDQDIVFSGVSDVVTAAFGKSGVNPQIFNRAIQEDD
jgi:anti-anti-sigma regulatory factor